MWIRMYENIHITKETEILSNSSELLCVIRQWLDFLLGLHQCNVQLLITRSLSEPWLQTERSFLPALGHTCHINSGACVCAWGQEGVHMGAEQNNSFISCLFFLFHRVGTSTQPRSSVVCPLPGLGRWRRAVWGSVGTQEGQPPIAGSRQLMPLLPCTWRLCKGAVCIDWRAPQTGKTKGSLR